MKDLKIITVFGTRPEAIKMAPLVIELKKHKHIESLVAVTGQHREMLDQVLQMFGIKPDFDLNIMKKNQTLADVTTNSLQGLEKVFKEVKPDMVLVHGDTTTTFVASLAAFYNQIQVGHVEAGLRTWDKQSPFPEEVNRQLTGVIADLHFAPTEKAAKNLLNEGKKEDSIFITGNTAIDALKTTVQEEYNHSLIENIKNNRLILLTAHRRENLGEPMRNMFRAIKQIVEEHPDTHVVYPVHLNPAVKSAAEEILGDHPRIQLINPLGVEDFHNLMSKAYLILTDSGGVQEEAPSLGVPVLVMRDTTERPEGVTAGTLKLAGTNREKIYGLIKELLTDNDIYNEMAKASNPYGDGEASKRIVKAINYHFAIDIDRPKDFEC